MKRLGILTTCVVVFLCGEVFGTNLVIREYDAKRHDRFYVGDDKAFIGDPLDWSGVSRTQRDVSGAVSYWVTMISPTYFVSANHWSPGAGETVRFYEGNDPAGPTHDYTIASWGHRVTTDRDLYIGKLTESLDPSHNICYYPVLELPSRDDYLDRDLFVYGMPDRVGHNTVDSIDSNDDMWFYYDDLSDPDEAKTVSGNSGGPSFIVCDGALALVGTHHYSCGDSFVPEHIDNLNYWMSDDGSDERVTVVPEPATLSLVAICLGMLVTRRKLRRRSI